MAKILKYTFKTPTLEVVDGELVENGSEEETCYFTLLHKGIGLYEEMAKEPLLATLTAITNKGADNEDIDFKKILSQDFISNLAAASYCKIEDNKFHNNRSTAEEFKKKPIYSNVATNIDFVRQLISMATDCISDENVKKQINKGDKTPKK